MMATTNSQPSAKQNLPPTSRFTPAWHGCLPSKSRFLIAIVFTLWMPVPHAFAETDRLAQAAAARAEKNYLEAKARWSTKPSDPEAAWQFGRTCFDWVELVRGDAKCANIAEEGIEACRQGIRLQPKLAGPHYYLGMNLGQLARTRTLGALKLVGQMETTFKTALVLDPTLDYAGPHRSLGLLYRDAPGWPVSIGNRAKAREHLCKAVELTPEYPDNWLSLLEAYLNWGEKKNVQAALSTAERALQKARETLKGEAWKLSWRDWDERWGKITAKAGVPSNVHDLRSSADRRGP